MCCLYPATQSRGCEHWTVFREGRNGAPGSLSVTPKDVPLVTAEWGGKPHSLAALPSDVPPGHPCRLRTQEMVHVAEPSSQAPDAEPRPGALSLQSLFLETVVEG